MTTSNNTFAETTIVAFHIGRGGRYYNPGHLSYIDNKPINEYVYDLFVVYENANDIYKKIGDRENLKDLFDKALDGDEAALTRFESIGLHFGEKIYVDGGGNPVGLTLAEAETGIGTINIDNQYDTTFTSKLIDCDERELRAILNTDRYVDYDILDYVKQSLGIEEETED